MDNGPLEKGQALDMITRHLDMYFPSAADEPQPQASTKP